MKLKHRALLMPWAGGAASLVASGLLIEYRFDDGSGTTLTDYVGGFNGTLGTGAADRPDWVAAGLDFIPANADVVINTTFPDTNVLGAITICVVANIDTGAAFRAFIGKCLTNGGSNNPFDFRTSNAATPLLILIRANGSGGVVREYAGQATTLGAYRMYSVVCSDGLVQTAPTFYIGSSAQVGSLVGGGNQNGAVTGSSASLRIGRRPDGAVQMDGIIAYILIYSRALSAGEIAQNYAALQTQLAPRGITLP